MSNIRRTGVVKAHYIPTVTAPIKNLQNKALINPTVLLVVHFPPAKKHSHSPINVSNCIPVVSLQNNSPPGSTQIFSLIHVLNVGSIHISSYPTNIHERLNTPGHRGSSIVLYYNDATSPGRSVWLGALELGNHL